MVNALRQAGLTVTGNDVYLPPDQPSTCWDREQFDQKWIGVSLAEQFDLVYAWDAMEHLPSLDQAFINIERLLKPGGIFVMHSPDFNRYKDNNSHPYWEPGHLWHMTPFSAELMLGPSDFSITHESGMVGGDPGLAAADNFVLWGIKK
jgi:2-polyprenyl-3-methyl-5-hydroxy-6-metoxy-1,4-benzoquinol methylase